MCSASDFRISKNGVLTKYTGHDRAVVIPDGVKGIGRAAFYNNYYLQSVKFPVGVKAVDYQAFEDCKNLEEIEFSDSLERIGDIAFRGCVSLKSVVIPKGVTEIGMYAFYGCTSLNDISIPDSVLHIGTDAFSINTSLVDNKGFLIVDGYLLKYCGNNSHAIIPEGVTAICNGAFYFPNHNDRIERISIPESVTSIGAEAFSGCRNLSTLVIPNGVTRVGAAAFSDCKNLRALAISEGVTSIESQTFTGCCNLERLDIPTSVTEIAKDAFDLNSPKLRIAIEDISILPLMFRSYAALCYAENGGSNTDLRSEGHRKYIKSNAAKLVDIAVSNTALLSMMCIEKLIPAKDAPTYLEAAQNSGNTEAISLMVAYSATKISAGEKSRAKKRKEAAEDNIAERKVMRQGKEDINELVFVVTGDLETFNNRTELKEFITEKGGKLAASLSSKVDYLIMNDASSNSEKSQKANELGIEIITEKQFNEKAGRQFVLENDSVLLYVGNGGNVLIPDGVKSIGSEAFMNCVSITAVHIPDSVTSIEEFAFDGCSNLIRVDIPSTTTNIGVCAFGLCSNLTIHAPAGSYAEAYAKEQGIPFVAE